MKVSIPWTDLLTTKEREVLVLYLDGLTHNEIAAHQGVSQTTIGVQVLNIRRKMKKFGLRFKRVVTNEPKVTA